MKCQFCEKEIGNLPFQCKYCKNYYCSIHRLPESHKCSGDLSSSLIMKHEASPINPVKINVKKLTSVGTYPSRTHSWVPYTKYFGAIVLTALGIFLALIENIVTQMMEVVVFHLILTVMTFGLAIILPLLLIRPRPKRKPKLTLIPELSKLLQKSIGIGILISLIFAFILASYGVAVDYLYGYGKGDFVTLFFTAFGAGLFCLGALFLEIKAYINETHSIKIFLKVTTIISSLIVILNITLIILIGYNIQLEFLSYSAFNSFIDYYWVFFALYIGFPLGRVAVQFRNIE